MEIFLKLKHWQLFGLTVGILLLLVLLSGATGRNEEEDRFVLDAIVRFVAIIPFLTYFLWIWSVGTVINKYISHHLRTHTATFYISVAVSYFIFFFIFIFNLFDWTEVREDADNSIWTYFLMAIPLIIAVFAWLFALNFVGKSLVRAERELHVRPSDYFGEYVMALLFPIGIWLLQPRINALYQRMKEELPKTEDHE